MYQYLFTVTITITITITNFFHKIIFPNILSSIANYYFVCFKPNANITLSNIVVH